MHQWTCDTWGQGALPISGGNRQLIRMNKAGDSMRLGIIGAGRVGLSLGKYFSETESVTLTGYYSRTRQSAEEGAAFTGSAVFSSIHDIFGASDTLLVATPDDEIASVWDCIVKECELAGASDKGRNPECSQKIVCHCSGSLSSEIFSENKRYGMSVCSMHPMYAFHHKYESYQQLHQAFFTLEGDERGVQAFTGLLSARNNHYAVIDSSRKVKYHCAAAIASNQIVALLKKSLDMLAECGFSETEAYEMLGPLAVNNVKNVFAHGVRDALTGPVERNDTATVKRHLAALDQQDALLYSLLCGELVSISESRHPEADYDEMRRVLEIADPDDCQVIFGKERNVR